MKKSNGGASILLIEDDTMVAESLKRLLTEHYRVETAATAEDGLAQAESRDFDVVVTDLQMPGISGLDFIKASHRCLPGSTKKARETHAGRCDETSWFEA